MCLGYAWAGPRGFVPKRWAVNCGYVFKQSEVVILQSFGCDEFIIGYFSGSLAWQNSTLAAPPPTTIAFVVLGGTHHATCIDC